MKIKLRFWLYFTMNIWYEKEYLIAIYRYEKTLTYNENNYFSIRKWLLHIYLFFSMRNVQDSGWLTKYLITRVLYYGMVVLKALSVCIYIQATINGSKSNYLKSKGMLPCSTSMLWHCHCCYHLYLVWKTAVLLTIACLLPSLPVLVQWSISSLEHCQFTFEAEPIVMIQIAAEKLTSRNKMHTQTQIML